MSLVSELISDLSMFLESSTCFLSVSPWFFFFLRVSSWRPIFSLDFRRPSISSCRVPNWVCRSVFSSVSFCFACKPSACCFFKLSFALSSLSFSPLKRSTSFCSSWICFWNQAVCSLFRDASSFFALISFCLASIACRSSLRSLSSFSLRCCCCSASESSCSSWSLKAWSSLPPAALSASSFVTLPVKSEFCCCSWTTCPWSMSRYLIRSFFSCTSWLTMFSWLMLRPAPCSTSRPNFEISVFRFWIVSLARCSFS
mmetsp:Transcript_49604/g.142221  ORF Transcript_49604/g.142221 Transcript_49604/m.142221 type:complete len:256 (+) Transcript_49604:1539-2306(+)